MPNIDKIVFVNPPYERVAPGYDFVHHITNRSPSMGLLYLAAVARQGGYQPSIIEGDLEGLHTDDVISRVVELNPGFVGITLFTVGVTNAAMIASGIKKALPGVVILVGGPHISSMGKETMARYTDFDIAVIHEGEGVLLEILERVKNSRPLIDIPDLYLKENGAIYRTESKKNNYVKMDDLPLPAWDLLPGFPDRYRPAIFDYPRGPVATIAASRGCPYKCSFCDTSTFGTRVRSYSPEKVFAIVRHLHTQYGVRHIQFVDDLFVASKSRTESFCNAMIESGMKVTWSCAARVDVFTEELLRLMKRAGCWEISFGLESGSDEMLMKMQKKADTEKARQAIQWTSDAGIRCKGLFMLGYPGETDETVELTREFVQQLPMTTMNLTKFTPYPGSAIYHDLFHTSIREEDWDLMNGMNFVWESSTLSRENLEKYYREILISFYRRHKIMKKYVRLAVLHPHHLVRLFRFFAGFLAFRLKSLIVRAGSL